MNTLIGDSTKILIINIFGIGDVLFTTPLLSNIKAHAPGCRIFYLANRRTAPVLMEYADIEKVFVYERDEFVEVYKRSKREYWQKGRKLLAEIKAEKFDVVLDLSLNGSMSFFMSRLGIPQRIGYNYKNRSPFLTTKIPLKGYEERHVIEYYLDLLKPLGIAATHRAMHIPIPEDERMWARLHLEHNNLQEQKPVLLLPGGGASWGKDADYKRWPAENYAKIADKIIEKFSAPIILMGDKKEKELCSRVGSLMKHKPLDFSGQTSIIQLAAMASVSRAVIVNDGGPLHIAVAAKAKTVSIFGPVDERVYGPYPADSHVVITKPLACRPCYRRFRRADCGHVSCLKTLTVEEVFEKIESAL